MTLDVSAFDKALASLREALVEHDRTHSPFVRDACIQRFKYTYDLAHKMLRRQLAAMMASPSGLQEMSFQELIRAGAGRGLLASGWNHWRRFRDARAMTSDAYDEDEADAVFARIPAFRDEASLLLERLKARNR